MMPFSLIGAGIVKLDARKKEPLFRQIYSGIRGSILSGRLAKGIALPSSRDLASQLSVSRMTVVNAFDQLMAEGYLTTRQGAGTFVSDDLPEEKQLVQFHSTNEQPRLDFPAQTTRSYLSNNGMRLVKFASGQCSVSHEHLRPFCPGVPALDLFPFEVWSKLQRQVWKRVTPQDISYGQPAGFDPLRKSIAEYVQTFRGVRCEPGQVMVVSGTQQAVDVISRLLIDKGDHVLFENPGYRTARIAMAAAGAKIVPMPIDENGADVSCGIRKSPRAKMAYVTPSHQYPMGVTLTVERRIQLIDWAQKNRSVIVEDDYDSEYRYAHHPIPSLQGLDQSDRTVYIGSFSKVVYPAMSMGYAIVPPPMVEAFEAALGLVSRPPATIDQMVLNEFISKGHFGRHLRRMRKIHQERRTAFVDSVEEHLSGKLQIIGSDAGLHCTARILNQQTDIELARRIKSRGFAMRALSECLLETPTKEKNSKGGKNSKSGKPSARYNGLVFGFACSAPLEIKEAVREIAQVI